MVGWFRVAANDTWSGDSADSGDSGDEFQIVHFWWFLPCLVTRTSLRCNVFSTFSYPSRLKHIVMSYFLDNCHPKNVSKRYDSAWDIPEKVKKRCAIVRMTTLPSLLTHDLQKHIVKLIYWCGNADSTAILKLQIAKMLTVHHFCTLFVKTDEFLKEFDDFWWKSMNSLRNSMIFDENRWFP